MIKANKDIVECEGTFMELTTDFSMIVCAIRDHFIGHFGDELGQELFEKTVEAAPKYFQNFVREDGVKHDND